MNSIKHSADVVAENTISTFPDQGINIQSSFSNIPITKSHEAEPPSIAGPYVDPSIVIFSVTLSVSTFLTYK